MTVSRRDLFGLAAGGAALAVAPKVMAAPAPLSLEMLDRAYAAPTFALEYSNDGVTWNSAGSVIMTNGDGAARWVRIPPAAIPRLTITERAPSCVIRAVQDAKWGRTP